LLHFKNMTNNKKTNNIYTIPFTLASKLQHCCLLNKISSLLKALHTSPQPVTPVVEYSNPEVDQARIIKENRGKSGVYR
jgi:hypothetical protein